MTRVVAGWSKPISLTAEQRAGVLEVLPLQPGLDELEILDKIEEVVGLHAGMVSDGLNAKSAKPKDVRASIEPVYDASVALTGELERLYQERARDANGAAASALQELDECLDEISGYAGPDYREVVIVLSRLEDALATVMNQNDRPAGGGRPQKTADHHLTLRLANIWHHATGAEPKWHNATDGSVAGPFFDFLSTLQPIIGMGFSPSGQLKWLDQQRREKK